MVVSTGNWPEALDAVLRGLAAQSDPAFDVVVADDGSTSDTAETVARWTALMGTGSSTSGSRTRVPARARAQSRGRGSARHLPRLRRRRLDPAPPLRRRDPSRLRARLVPGQHPAAAQREPLAHGAARRCADRDLEHGGPDRPRARRDPRTGPPHAPRPAQGLAAPAPRLRSARQRLRVLHRRRPRRLRGGERLRRTVRRVGRPGRRSGRQARETRAACGYAGPRSAMLHLWHPSNAPADRPTWWLLQETIASDRPRRSTDTESSSRRRGSSGHRADRHA